MSRLRRDRPEPLAPRPAPAPPADYFIRVARDAASLLEHVPAWDDLARDAAEPNPFYESWNLLPALEQFGAGADLCFVLVYQPINAQRRAPVLCGFFPLRRRGLHPLLPVPLLESWRHLNCFLTTPLLRAGHAAGVLARFFDWMIRDPLGASLWRMEVASRDGAFGRALTQTCYHRARPSFLVEEYGWAFLVKGESAERYLECALPAKRRKDLRRQARRLAGQGRVEYRVLQAEPDLGRWTEDFLRLEAGGWKGQEGTALLATAGGADFFRAMARGAFRRGQLQMLGLFLDGEPVALKCNLVSGRGAFAYKIARDEAHAACSPGVLLELFNVEHLHATGGARWMDSCAIPDHPMIDRLWAERRVVQTRYVATGRRPGDAVVSAMPPGRWLKRCLGCPARRTASLPAGPGAAGASTRLPAAHAAARPAPRDGDPLNALRSPPAPAVAGGLLDVERPAFDASFGKEAFAIRHRLADHPLFAVPRLIELAKALPADRVEYNAGDLPVSADPARTPRDGLTAEETIRRIAECRSWLVLKNVERDPAYRELLEACLREVEVLGHPLARRVDLREAFVFVPSPAAVTPFHIDPELNFLLQIRGQKTIHVFPRDDRALVGEEDLERFYCGAHRNLPFRPEFQPKARTFVLRPGDGVHVPVTAPHWVENGPEVSISFSITFQTRESERRGIICRVNRWLRARGLTPTPAEVSGWRDGAKYFAYRVARRLGFAGRPCEDAVTSRMKA